MYRSWAEGTLGLAVQAGQRLNQFFGGFRVLERDRRPEGAAAFRR
jgi:hypothetical protein